MLKRKRTFRSSTQRNIRSAKLQMRRYAKNARNVDCWLWFFAPDARIMPPGAAPVEGKEAIHSFISELLTIPSFFVAHHLESVNVSPQRRSRLDVVLI